MSSIHATKPQRTHSYLRESTGLATAALMDWKLTVSIAMVRASADEMIKAHGLMLVR